MATITKEILKARDVEYVFDNIPVLNLYTKTRIKDDGSEIGVKNICWVMPFRGYDISINSSKNGDGVDMGSSGGNILKKAIRCILSTETDTFDPHIIAMQYVEGCVLKALKAFENSPYGEQFSMPAFARCSDERNSLEKFCEEVVKLYGNA